MARSSPMAASTSSAPGQGWPVLPDRRVSQNAKLPRAGIARFRRPESDLQRRPQRHVLVVDRMEGSGLCGSLRHGGGLRCGHVHTGGHNTLTVILRPGYADGAASKRTQAAPALRKETGARCAAHPLTGRQFRPRP